MRQVPALLVCFASAAFSRSDRGAITGSFADPAGAMIASAAIEARNLDTRVVYQVVSTATGRYTIGELSAGKYEIAVAVPGFKKYVRSGITVEVAQTLRIDVALEVGSAVESITVEADASLLETESGELSHTIPVQAPRRPPIGIGGTLSSSQGSFRRARMACA
jgi:hypothetical protein